MKKEKYVPRHEQLLYKMAAMLIVAALVLDGLYYLWKWLF